MKINKKLGLSLIVLVITIIVIMIIATATIQVLKSNNTVNHAKKVAFQNDLSAIEENIQLYKNRKYNEYIFKFDKSNFDIESPDKAIIGEEYYENYKDKVKINDGKLCLKSEKVTEEEKKWAEEIGIETN